MISPASTEKQTVRVAIYTRVSTPDQANGDFTSIDSQEEYCRSFGHSQRGKGWEEKALHYSDPGISGTTMNRPGFTQLLNDAGLHLFDVLVVYRFDRLSRNNKDFHVICDRLESLGISIVSVSEQINTTEPAGRAMRSLMATFSQLEVDTTSQRTLDKIATAKRQGRWCGGIPVLGYDAVDKKLVVNEDEAPMVREIFNLYLKHRSVQKVCAEINRRGWTTKSWTTKTGHVRVGKPFSKSTLAHLLANVTLIGHVSHRGQVYPGEHPGLIRKSTFDRVQAILKKGQQASGEKVSNKYNFLLKGLLRCKACGTAYVPTTTRKGSKVYRYYACSGAQKNGFKTCPRPTLSAHKMEQLVAQQIRVIGQDPALQAEVLRQTKRATRAETGRLKAEQKQLAAKRDKVAKETNGLLQALAGGQAPGTSISSRLAELEAQTAVLDRRLREIETELQTIADSTVDPADLAQTLSLFEPIWDVLFPAEQARIIHLLVREIEFDGASGKFGIRFHPTGIRALAGEMELELAR